MASYTDGPTKTFTVSAALKDYRRVVLSSGKLAYGGDADAEDLGVTTRETFAADETVAVWLRGKQGTLKLQTTAAAVAVGDVVYKAANGQVAATGTRAYGTALSSVGAAGGVIEVLPS